METKAAAAEWTPTHEDLLKLDVEYGSVNGDGVDNVMQNAKYISNEPVFPVHLKRYANQHRQILLRSKKRGKRWIVPSFPASLYSRLKQDEHITYLFERASNHSSLAIPSAIMGRSASQKKQSAEDESVADYSFCNDEGLTDDDVDGTLAKAMTRKANISPLRSPARSPTRHQKQKPKYTHAANVLQLVFGASGNPIDNFSVSLTQRKSDDGDHFVRAITIKHHVASVLDQDKVSANAVSYLKSSLSILIRFSIKKWQHIMKFSKLNITPNGYTALEYTTPAVSAADAADLDQILSNLQLDIDDENVTNTDVNANDHTAARFYRSTAMSGAIADEYNDDKSVKMKTRTLMLPRHPDSNLQLSAHNQYWQGDKSYKKPADDFTIKGRFQPSWYEEKGPDGTEYEGCRFCMIWEIPISEKGYRLLDLNPTATKSVSQASKLASGKALVRAKNGGTNNNGGT